MSSPLGSIHSYESFLEALKNELIKKKPNKNEIDLKIERLAQEMSYILDPDVLQMTLTNTKSYLLIDNGEIRNANKHKSDVDNVISSLKSKIKFSPNNQSSSSIQPPSKAETSTNRITHFVYKQHAQGKASNFPEKIKIMQRQGEAIVDLEKYLKIEKAKRFGIEIQENLNNLEFAENFKAFYKQEESNEDKLKSIQKVYNALTGEGDYVKKLKEVIEHLDQQLVENRKNREAFTSTYVKTFLINPTLFNLFLKRVAKVCSEKTFEEMGVEAAEQFLKANPGDILVTQAILEDFQYVLIDNTLLFLENFSSMGDKMWLSKAADFYQNLPEIVRHTIEIQIGEKIGQNKEPEESKNLLIGKNYAEDFFNQKIESINGVVVYEALTEYLTTNLQDQPNLTRFCDESIKGLAFKIIDEKGNIRGYVLGTSHSVPEEFVKFRKEIRNAFYKSTVLIAERIYEHTEQEILEEIKEAKKEKLGLMDLEFILQAKQEGKPTLGAYGTTKKKIEPSWGRME